MNNNPFDRNKTSNSHEARLGHFIGADALVNKRDAVHIAVAPVIAGMNLSPGDRVAILKDGETAVAAGRNEDLESDGAVGIVDPFLPGWEVKAGSRFWLFLFQGSVVTLRHEWTHPAFPDPGSPMPKMGDKEASEMWLRIYASRVNSYLEPEKAFRQLLSDIEDKAITYHGTDMHSRSELEDEAELRKHLQVYLGKPVNFDDFEYFSCTC